MKTIFICAICAICGQTFAATNKPPAVVLITNHVQADSTFREVNGQLQAYADHMRGKK